MGGGVRSTSERFPGLGPDSRSLSGSEPAALCLLRDAGCDGRRDGAPTKMKNTAPGAQQTPEESINYNYQEQCPWEVWSPVDRERQKRGREQDTRAHPERCRRLMRPRK